MNVDGGVLQAFETTVVDEEKNTFVKTEVNENINGIVVFKRSTKYIKYLNLFFKRIMDIIGSLVGIVILIPLTVIVKLINVLNKDYGPIFYSHERIGKNGKHFKMYKFRSMCMDSQEVLEKILFEDEDARKEWEETMKLKNDPRITKIGSFLRINLDTLCT